LLPAAAKNWFKLQRLRRWQSSPKEGFMDRVVARRLYAQNASSVAYVDVELPNGSRSIGSAFHLGEGVFVTARHVVEGNRIVEVCATEPFPVRAREVFPYLPDDFVDDFDTALGTILGKTPYYKEWNQPFQISIGPLFLTTPISMSQSSR
jgi:hypothetical protein